MRMRSRLLLSTSILALTLAGMPIDIDFSLGEIGLSVAQAKCCFSARTPILMADGATQPIAQVRVGDRVLSRTGRTNLVVGLEKVPLAGRHLFAINDLEPFFTAEHPFLSPTGWKAVDTAAAVQEAGLLDLTPMCAGDLLVTARQGVAESSGATALAPGLIRSVERILTLRAVRPGADLPVFNLLLDGDHSYVANGFVVHNKDGEGGSGGGSSGEGGSGSGSSGESGSGEGGSGSGESGSGGGSGESGSGDSGESGSGSEGGSGESGSGGEGGSDRDDGFSGTADRAGPDLTPDEERALILRRWGK